MRFAVIGSPVAQSKSPQMFNAAFRERGLNAVYERIEIQDGELAPFIQRVRHGDFAGLNVTMPHKQTILPLLDSLTPLASRIGAVNTVFVRDDKLIGDNTDCEGFVTGLVNETGLTIKDAKILILGAGGAARAICFGLCAAGALSLTIVNRDQNKALPLCRQLTAEFDLVTIEHRPWSVLDNPLPDDLSLIVNATALGMEDRPWPHLEFVNTCPQLVCVADIVTQDKDTELITAAKHCGLKTMSGLTMLLHQAVLAFELMTGQKAPVEVMRAVQS